MSKRMSADELRGHVAWALLNLNRPDLLEDSPLLPLLNIRSNGVLWARGRALHELLRNAASRVSDGLADIPAMSRHRSLLDGVVQDDKSLSQWAREQGRSREGVSRRLWKEVTAWVAEEVERLALLSSSAHTNR